MPFIRYPTTNLAIGMALTAALLATPRSNAKVAQTQLKEIFWDSSIVALGQDIGTLTIDEWTVGVFEIEEVIKGDANKGDRIHYIAESTWTCDVSGSVVGSRAILFFTKNEPPKERVRNHLPPSNGRFPPPSTNKRGEPVLSLSASGYSRIDLQNEAAIVQTVVVVLPDELAPIGERKQHEEDTSVLASEIQTYLRRLGAERPQRPTPTIKTGPLPRSMLRP